MFIAGRRAVADGGSCSYEHVAMHPSPERGHILHWSGMGRGNLYRRGQPPNTYNTRGGEEVDIEAWEVGWPGLRLSDRLPLRSTSQ